MYFYRDPAAKPDDAGEGGHSHRVLVNRIRQQVKAWRKQDYPGVLRTTLDLLQWWRRDGRERPLFFAQLEAAKTVMFLVESRPISARESTFPARSWGRTNWAKAIGLSAVCLQNGYRDRQNDGDGDDCRVEHPQQGQ